jgi:hypothetical protein
VTSYTVLAVYKEDMVYFDQAKYSVAHRNEETGFESYFVTAFQMGVHTNEHTIIQGLLSGAYSVGGIDLRNALQDYIQANFNAWDNKPFTHKIVSSYDTSSADWFSSDPYKSPPIIQSSKIILSNEELFYNNGGPKFPGTTYSKVNKNDPSILAQKLPGINEMVKHPTITKDDLQCGSANIETSLSWIIIHLNDYHRWTREAIADWLESLDLDLRFKTPEEPVDDKVQPSNADHTKHVHAKPAFSNSDHMHFQLSVSVDEDAMKKLLTEIGEQNEQD